MRITHDDLHRWKRDSISVALASGLDKDVLEYIDKSVELSVRHGHSYPRFFGCAKILFRDGKTPEETIKIPLEVLVYEINPSARLPYSLREVYNQSGMDHEFIGHVYNSAAGLPCNERAAVKRQMEFAYYRAGKNNLWKAALVLMPAAAASISVIKAFRK